MRGLTEDPLADLASDVGWHAFSCWMQLTEGSI
jgi:hypothetical protein